MLDNGLKGPFLKSLVSVDCVQRDAPIPTQSGGRFGKKRVRNRTGLWEQKGTCGLENARLDSEWGMWPIGSFSECFLSNSGSFSDYLLSIFSVGHRGHTRRSKSIQYLPLWDSQSSQASTWAINNWTGLALIPAGRWYGSWEPKTHQAHFILHW